MSEFLVDILPDEPAAEIIAKWQYAEWGSGYNQTDLADFLVDIRRAIRSEEIPLILVATAESEIVGTASIIENDLPLRKDLNPWLASVFVRPDWRRKGIASQLIKVALTRARLIRIKKIFLFTHDLQEFYNEFAFVTIDQSEFMGKKVYIMECNLDTAIRTCG